MSNVVNGLILEKMMRNALNNLYVHEKEINDMNVFPVADGDTGTNMRLTLENGLNHASSEKHLGKYLKNLSIGMLLGARGNSGVILSQLFKGMYLELKNDSIVNPGEFRDAFIVGYKTAYKAVLKPVEGTILTVARLGIENIKHQIKGSISIKETFNLYLNELNKSLELTPNMLPILKEANVLDSGAKGYTVIVEGMYKYLLGQIVDCDLVMNEIKDNTDDNNEEEGFRIEFKIKLNEPSIDIKEMIKKIKELSIKNDIHIQDDVLSMTSYSLDPSPIIKEAKKYGEVISFKLDNMKLSNVKEEETKLPFKGIVYIACVSGSGIKNLYKEMGVDLFLSLNPSTQDFLDAFKKANAEKIVILPNDKNILETAYQAVKLSKLTNVIILPTKNAVEGYYSLAMDIPDSTIENRVAAIQEEVGVECIKIAKAIKEYHNDKVAVKIGEYIAYIDDEILASNKEILKCLKSALDLYQDKSSAFVLLGKNINEELSQQINDLFIDNYSSIEASIFEGGQDKEDLIIGLL